MVFASFAVVSAMRFAARPVGAARKTGMFLSSAAATRTLMRVVFPVPGPPVMTRKF